MKSAIIAALEKSLAAIGLLDVLKSEQLSLKLEQCKNADHGDFACNIAMTLARFAKKNPRELAQAIVDHLPDEAVIERVDIAGPGFINFFVKTTAQFDVLKTIFEQGQNFGCSHFGNNEKVHIEFVSANPTGPLHVGHGRGAAYGSVVSDLLEKIGFDVYREYYVNDAGRQMHILATSVWLRYLELNGEKFTFPKNAYRGDYIIDIAKMLLEQQKKALIHPIDAVFAEVPEDEHENGGDKEAHIDALIKNAQGLLGNLYETVFDLATKTILSDIRDDLSEFKVNFQNWFSEKSLMHNGAVAHGIEKLEQLGFVYEKNSAKWFKSSEFGDEKDRVLQRDDGRTTYFASDVAYHLNKVERGFTRIIDVLGADHHGYVPRVRASMRALGVDDQHFNAPLVQFAVLYRGGEKVQMSTRSGSFVTLRELREEVGSDAARFFYIMRKAEQHLDFDLDLAKSKSNENPVYYIQYAHARICQVFSKLKQANRDYDQTAGLSALDQLTLSHETDLAKHLARYPDVVLSAGKNLEPHLLANYLKELAQYFHAYYNAEQFIVENESLCQARLALVAATKQVLHNGLSLLRISAPETM